MPIASINPATGETLRTFPAHSDAEVDERIERARAVFHRWKRTNVAERASVLATAAHILERDKERFARIMTQEMGKTLRAAVEEAAKCALACRYYADHAAEMLAPQRVLSDGAQSGDVVYQPLGVVLAVMPWNFPFWQVIRFAAPALAAGNVGLLKHASNVPQCALALEELFRDAGAPDGVFTSLLIESSRVAPLIGDARVAAVTLTGSEPAGRDVGAAAGRHIKKSVLELGGSDPFIVMPSADVERAAAVAVKARTINNGQSCIAAKRFIVAESVAAEFEAKFVAGMRALVVGDPMAPETEVGPLATDRIAAEVEQQVAATLERGGRLLTGGRRRAGSGYFFEPTVIADPPPDSPAYRDEVFGPVASLFRVRGIDEAIRLANDTTFGLGASVWTREPNERQRFVDDLETGQVFVNAMVASDPRLPFGGVKHSGYGRELGRWGLREFVNVKTVRSEGVRASETE